MEIFESKQFDPLSALAVSQSNAITLESVKCKFIEILDVEVEPVQAGLQVVRIGKESPLSRLQPVGGYSMQGRVESGDRIVAIDGVSVRTPTDVARIIGNRRFCEIAIFDHRTRLTVSWQFYVCEMLEAA